MTFSAIRKRAAAIIAAGLVLAVLAAPALPAQTGSDEALARKHKDILGRYEFDLTALGGALKVIEVVVREGALWLDDGDGRPLEIKPVENSALEFAGTDAVQGPIRATFAKDDSGAVATFRMVAPNLTLDILGKKLK